MRRYQLEAYKGRRKPQGPIRFKRGPKLGLQLGLHVLDATTGRPSARFTPTASVAVESNDVLYGGSSDYMEELQGRFTKDLLHGGAQRDIY